jgi:hypothetical protein
MGSIGIEEEEEFYPSSCYFVPLCSKYILPSVHISTDSLDLCGLKYEILNTETVKMMPCSLVAVYRSFRGTVCLSLSDLNIYRTTWSHIQEHNNIHP